MPMAAGKQWRAVLSTTTGGANGGPVHAIDRVGSGPWYDRLGRVVALNVDALANARPEGADPAIIDDLPNEYDAPNHAPDGEQVDNHHVLTGSNTEGRLYQADPRYTCQDWTSAAGADGTPRVGMSWPRDGGGGRPGGGGADNWISSMDEAGCAPGGTVAQTGPAPSGSDQVGGGGGYGAFYCFALVP